MNVVPRKEADDRDEKKEQVAQHHVHTEDAENKYDQNAQKQTTTTKTATAAGANTSSCFFNSDVSGRAT